MVWSVTISSASCGVFATEHAAYKSCCFYIQSEVKTWDMNKYDLATRAQMLNNYINAISYLKAIEYYNHNCDGDIIIKEENVLAGTDINDPEIFPPDYFTALNCPNTIVGSTLPIAFNFSSAPKPPVQKLGATCKSCNQYNGDTYATNNDGTYLCRGCKLMRGVFG